MNILEAKARPEGILDFIDHQLAALNESGVTSAFVIVGTGSYEILCAAISDRFHRPPGTFETYQSVPIVVDPFRDNTVAVVPAASHALKGLSGFRLPD